VGTSNLSRKRLLLVGCCAALVSVGLVVGFLFTLLPGRGRQLPRPAAPGEPPGVGPGPISLPAVPEDATVDQIVGMAKQVGARLVASFPQSPQAHCVLGEVEYRFGNSAGAVRHWERCLELDPRFVEAYYRIAMDAMNKGDDGKAAQLLRRAMKTLPRAPQLANQLAKALMNQGELDQAMAVLKDNLRVVPDFAGNHFLAGQILLLQEKYQEAAGYLERALAIEPDYSHACFALATVYARLGDGAKARQYRERFAQLRAEEEKQEIDELRRLEDRSTVLHFLACAYRDAARVYYFHGDQAAAEAHWVAAARIGPEDVESRLALVQLYLKRGRARDALEGYRELSRMEPQRLDYLLEIGRLCAELGQFEGAEEAFRRCSQVAPQRAVGYAALARLYLRARRKLAEVPALAEKAVQLEPTARNLFLLSAARESCGDRQGALLALKKAIELDPDNPLYRQAYESFSQ